MRQWRAQEGLPVLEDGARNPKVQTENTIKEICSLCLEFCEQYYVKCERSEESVIQRSLETYVKNLLEKVAEMQSDVKSKE